MYCLMKRNKAILFLDDIVQKNNVYLKMTISLNTPVNTTLIFWLFLACFSFYLT